MEQFKTAQHMKAKFLLLVLSFALLHSACKKKDDPIAPIGPVTNEEEVITNLTLTFTDPSNANEQYVFRFADPDGEGGADPVITADALPSDTTLLLALTLANASGSITQEISNEGTDHQFFFQRTGVPFIVVYDDTDANGRPIGLRNVASTGSSGSGTLLVTLRHQAVKDAPDVAGGDITNAFGDTDIEVVFPLVVQ